MFGPNEETFRRHLIGMKKYADPISESDLIVHVNHGFPLPKRSFMITFDDGYSDNYHRALPVLKELGIPGIFFVPTASIESRMVGWWDLIYWCIKLTQKKQITVRGVTYGVPRPVSALAEVFTAMLKEGSDATKKGLVEEISIACEVPLPTLAETSRELMTWDELRDAETKGISIGSHTHTHRVLSGLSLEEQRQEFLVSKKIIEQRLGKTVRSIAYPVGGYEHFNEETMWLSQECGYDLGFSFLTGVNPVCTMHKGNIKRLDRQLDLSTYSGIFSMPWLFGVRTCGLKEPFSIGQKSLRN